MKRGAGSEHSGTRNGSVVVGKAVCIRVRINSHTGHIESPGKRTRAERDRVVIVAVVRHRVREEHLAARGGLQRVGLHESQTVNRGHLGHHRV